MQSLRAKMVRSHPGVTLLATPAPSRIPRTLTAVSARGLKNGHSRPSGVQKMRHNSEKSPPPPPYEHLVVSAGESTSGSESTFTGKSAKLVQKPSLTGSEFTFTHKMCEIRPKPPTDASGASDCQIQVARGKNPDFQNVNGEWNSGFVCAFTWKTERISSERLRRLPQARGQVSARRKARRKNDLVSR